MDFADECVFKQFCGTNLLQFFPFMLYEGLAARSLIVVSTELYFVLFALTLENNLN